MFFENIFPTNSTYFNLVLCGIVALLVGYMIMLAILKFFVATVDFILRMLLAAFVLKEFLPSAAAWLYDLAVQVIRHQWVRYFAALFEA